MSSKTPNNTMRIAPSLDALPKIDYRKVQDFQGGLKTLSEENFERLRCVLLGTDTEPAQGFIVPLYVWTDSKGKHWCIDGHQRLQVLRRLAVQPYELPYVPIEANSRKQAKERLLLINSQFGQISHTGFVEFVGSDIAPEWLRTYTTLESYTMPKVEFSFGAAGAGAAQQQGAAQDNADYEQDYDDDDDIAGSANIGFLKNINAAELDEDAEIQDVFHKVKYDIKSGDVIQIDKHFLICGDSQNIDTYRRLLQDVKADIVVTSPPYNAGSSARTGEFKNKEKNKLLYSKNIDNKTKEEYIKFGIDVLANCSQSCKSDAAILWNASYNAKSREEYGKIVFSDNHGLSIKETIVWDKKVGVSLVHSGILSRRCEFVFLLCAQDKYFTNQLNEVWFNYWRIGTHNAQETQEHKAAFPAELVQKSLQCFGRVGGLTLDPFGGTGTTMIVSEAMGFTNYSIELMPDYCNLIINRYLKYYPDAVVFINGQKGNKL